MNSPAYKALKITANTLRLRASKLMDNPHVLAAFDAMVRGKNPPEGTPYEVWGFVCSQRLFIAQFDALVCEKLVTRDEAEELERISINA
jgi:hypothetical protein